MNELKTIINFSLFALVINLAPMAYSPPQKGTRMPGEIIYQTFATGRKRIKALKIDGKTQTVTEWSEESGIPPSAILHRLKTMSVKDAVYHGAPPKISIAHAWPVPSNTLANELGRWR